MEQVDLTYKKRFLDFLGYSYQQIENDRWVIRDENDNEIGHIYKNNDEPMYSMNIDSDSISYISSGLAGYKLFVFSRKNFGTFWLDFDEEYSSSAFFPSMAIYNDKLGDINIYTLKENFESSTKYSLIIDFCYEISGYRVSEQVCFCNMVDSNNNSDISYRYERTYYKGTNEMVGYEIEAHDSYESNTLLIDGRVFEEHNLDQKIRENEKKGFLDRIRCYIPFISRKKKYELEKDEFYHREEYNKTVVEFAKEHERGIEIFKMARDLFSEYIPSKRDATAEMLNNIIRKFGIELFFKEDKVQFTKEKP